MRVLLFCGVLLVALSLAYGQGLIIDEDDPAGKKLIDLMMKAINEHEKPTTYKFKTVVYSIPIGDNKKIQVLMKVTNASGVSFQVKK